MLSTVYVACLLAASAIAHPVHYEARGFSSYSQDSNQSARNHGSQASLGPFGGSMSSHDDASSATTHNSGSTMIGGGVGGFGTGGGFGFANAGGMSASNSMSSSNSNQMSASNGFSAGGIGGGVGMIGGGFGMNQQNSFSASSAISNFQNVNSMIGQMQSTLMSGSMSSTVAYQSMQQLAQSLQIAMTHATGCNACFAGHGFQFASAASSTFNQFTRFISQMQGAFGGQICTLLARHKFTVPLLDKIENVIPSNASIQAEEYPTMKFKPAGSRQFIAFDDERESDAVIAFIPKNSVNKVMAVKVERPEPVEGGEGVN
ncbi:hypothetical protein PSTG_12311 [Puccinia striiformis f. sp. tritici PST-78]|uniref:Uncharacterized protein n=1 Tax=Puccinia striiformis f. sp. tritici PST-78 TaxID=1165861 RepID=A0A0L0V511_9BASI|nr:hypothetical protein PSTG_12311 [Puccinia striiformis f. sp. tritici PST-78]